MEDRSKADVSGVSVPSDESRDAKISFFGGTVSRNGALIFSLITVFVAIAVGWNMNDMTIPIEVSTLMICLTTYFDLFKSTVQKATPSTQELQQHTPILETNDDECEEVSPPPISKGKLKLHELKAQCEKVEQRSTGKMNSGPSEPPILLLPLKEISRNKTCTLRKCELGTSNSGKEEKVIMLVGSTGAGKITLINGMVNYVLGVEWEDNFRFKMILDEDEKKLRTQAVRQTQGIIVYTLHHENHFKIPFTLTIIDTPDFGDTRGIEYDNKTLKQISEFFHTKDAGGIDHINAIGIVIPSFVTPLTHKQKFILDDVLSLFGTDVKENIFLMITFSDGKIPPVLDAITKAGIPHTRHFKFNNSALFSTSSVNYEDINDDTGFDRMFWNLGSESFDKFFVQIQKIENKSLQLTINVLERMSLETFVQEIRLQVEDGLNKLEQYKTEFAVLKKHQIDVALNKNFIYEVTEDTAVKEDIPNGQHTTTCLKCNFTCHDLCSYGDDSDKYKCCAMRNGSCTRCPDRCYWQTHKNMPYRIIIKRETKTKKANDLKVRYEKAVKEELTLQTLIEQVSQDFTAVQINVIYLTDQIRKSLVRLDEIASRPNPMTTIEYIEILIESEKKEYKTGWRERVKQLEAARVQAKTLYNLADENFDPFAEYGESYKELMKEGGDKIIALRKLLGKLKSGSDTVFNTVRNFLDSESSNTPPECCIN